MSASQTLMDRIVDDDEVVKNIRNDIRYYLYTYLEANKDKLKLPTLDDDKQ